MSAIITMIISEGKPLHKHSSLKCLQLSSESFGPAREGGGGGGDGGVTHDDLSLISWNCLHICSGPAAYFCYFKHSY